VEDLALLGLLAHVQSLTCGAAHIAVSLFTGASRALRGNRVRGPGRTSAIGPLLAGGTTAGIAASRTAQSSV